MKKLRRKDSDKKEYKKSNLESKILKNKSEDKDSHFLVIFSYSKSKNLLRQEKGWLTDVGHNLWLPWNQLKMAFIKQIWKD